MAKNAKQNEEQIAQSEQNEEQKSEVQSEQPEERVVVALNPDTGLRGYAFSDNWSAVVGKRYKMDKSRYEDYAKEKHLGKQVLIKS
jgi:hypothetical protein